MLPPDMPIWHKDYFELKVIENNRIRKSSISKQKFITKDNFWPYQPEDFTRGIHKTNFTNFITGPIKRLSLPLEA